MKYMNLKRFASLAMTGAIALSLAAPAFAAYETEITGVYKESDIAVTVPTTGQAFINPFGLDMKLKEIGDDGSAASGAVEANISGQQIVTAPMFISNESGMNLQVGATVTGVATGDVRFAAESAAESTAKSVYAYLQATQAADLTGATLAAADKAEAYAAWEPKAYDATTDVIVSDRGASTDNLVVLKAADMSGSGGAFAAYKAGSVAMVRLSGDCPAAPRDAWIAAEGSNPGDGFTVTVAYTFSPIVMPTFAITKGTLTRPAGETTATAPADSAWSIDLDKASEGDTVTITVTKGHKDDYITFTVAGAAGTDPIEIEKGKGTVADSDTTGGKEVTFTFTMPAYAVTVNGSVTST